MYTADIDVGGTFTDGFFTRDTDSRRSKVLTTPHDLTECFLNCLREGAAAFDVPLHDFLRGAAVVRLSTTLGTNTLLQRRGPRVGLIVSDGHERDLYGPDAEAAVLRLFLQPEMVVGLNTVAEADVLAAVRTLVDRGARIIAVSLAGSWRNPADEQHVRAIVTDRYPEHYLRSIPLQLSHQVSWAADDHARTNTTVLNAYLHSELARGLFRAEDLAREQGMQHPLLVVHAGGGCARVAKTVAVQTLSSGPAVAIGGALAMARLLGLQRVVTADMGGTSLDVAILDGGTPPVSETPLVMGLPLGLEMIQTTSIGAGGGSIARALDGQIEVGPESAGSAPGPACYDKGGMQPTVTDANLVLGFLDPDRFLNGRMKLNLKRAEDMIRRRVAGPLNQTVEEVAAAIRARIDQKMADDIGARLREQQLDPATVTLFAFGGGGPLHGGTIAERIGINRIVGFPFGSVFSAFGSSTTDVRHTYQRTLAMDITDPADPSTATRAALALADLRRQAALDMRGEGFSPDDVAYSLDVVLAGSDGERRVPVAMDAADGGIDTARFGPDAQELRRLILTASAGVPHWLPAEFDATTSSTPAIEQRRAVRWSGVEPIDTPLYRLESLQPLAALNGPAIIEAPDTSYAVPANWSAHLDRWGNVVMERQ